MESHASLKAENANAAVRETTNAGAEATDCRMTAMAFPRAMRAN
jgi:hypothetical protein